MINLRKLSRRKGVYFKTILVTISVLLIVTYLKINKQIDIKNKIGLKTIELNDNSEMWLKNQLPKQIKEEINVENFDILKATLKPVPDDLFEPENENLPKLDQEIDSHLSQFDNEISEANSKIVPGLGERGIGVNLEGEELETAKVLMKKEAFNILLSDKISLNRSVADSRDTLCKTVKYIDVLPSASIIIIFTNEAWSPLLRTVWSVLNRSPLEYVKEIILVDDFSDRLELKGRLQRYVTNYFPPLVKLHRLTERHGLIRARLAGAEIALGEVIVFLDSHCEVNEKWLEPLLQRISESESAVVMPIIDVIDDKTMEYYHGNEKYFQIGGFTWSGHFTWIDVPERERQRRKNQIAPTRSPTMAGGLFAISKNYFWKIGGYDPGMDVWGGENLEMSFRIWMCGGTLEVIPCSRVGHIFRDFHPYTFPGNKDTHGINTARMVEVWMDEYKRLFYMYRPELQKEDIGDISERVALRKDLKCHSFKWFLNNVIPEKFILDENVLAYGRIRNTAASPNLCFDNRQYNENSQYNAGLYFCNSELSSSQFFSMSIDGELRREEMCAEAVFVEENGSTVGKVLMAMCHGLKGSQEWEHIKNGPIRHIVTGTCIDREGLQTMDDLYIKICNQKPSQNWQFDHYI